MNNLLLSILLIFFSFGLIAQNNYVSVKQRLDGYSNNEEKTNNNKHINNTTPQKLIGAGVANKFNPPITSIPIGSAGNVYTIIEHPVHALDANQDLNTVIFIHRNNDQVFGGINGEYRYDISKNGGQTWSLDIGILNPMADSTGLQGRFPGVAIYNPEGNTIADSAYFNYLGTYHNAASWEGTFTGVAQLSNNPLTFTQDTNLVNNGEFLRAMSLTNGTNDSTYWAVAWGATGYFYPAPSTQKISDLIILKGTFSNVIKDISWVIDTIINVPYELNNGNPVVTSPSIAFDTSGQIGWIGFTGDVSLTGPDYYDAIFYKTIDGGNSWQGPIVVDPDSFPNVRALVSSVRDTATTAFQSDIGVDIYGNPHFSVVIGPAGNQDYSITLAYLGIYDITYNSDSSRWEAIFLDSIRSFGGKFLPDKIYEEHRPQVSVSPDRDKVFISWLDSDPAVTGSMSATNGENNYAPNFLGCGIDVVNKYKTLPINFTIGDPVWKGLAMFAAVSPNTLKSGITNNVPTVFTQLPSSGSDLDPAFFHYISNIDYDDTAFTECLYSTKPYIVLIGGDSVAVGICPATYTDPGAVAMSCNGDITDSIVVGGDVVDTTIAGSYYVTYYVIDDQARSSDTLTRTVFVTLQDITAPVINLNGSNSICIGLDSSFTDQGATATDNCEGNLTDSIQVTGTVDTGVVGTYILTYTVSDTNSNVSIVTRNIVVTEAPNAVYNYTSGGGTAIIFDDLSTNNPTSWLWDFGDGNFSIIADPVNTYSVGGDYTVCLTVTNCGGTDSICKNLLKVGIDEKNFNNAISVHPNPSEGLINLDIASVNTKDITITLYDILGKAIQVINKGDFRGQNKITIDLSDQPNGVYMLEVRNVESIMTKKITLFKKQ